MAAAALRLGDRAAPADGAAPSAAAALAMPPSKRPRGTHLRRERVPEPAPNSVTVGGLTYQWELRHGWGAAPGAGYRGVSVSVWVRRLQTRELIVDFPFELFGREPRRRRSSWPRSSAPSPRRSRTAGSPSRAGGPGASPRPEGP